MLKRRFRVVTALSLVLLMSSYIQSPLGAVLTTSKENEIMSLRHEKDSETERETELETLPDQFVCAFFYPWYGNHRHHWIHWGIGGHSPPSTWASYYLPDVITEVFDPSQELYDSQNETIILWQLESMKRASIRVAICSWWGTRTYADQTFRKIINLMDKPECTYRDLKWCIYYEPEAYGDPTVDDICNDLQYIIENYGRSPYYFKLEGKYVFFIFTERTVVEAEKWKKVRDKLGDVFTVLLEFEGYEDYSHLADSWHQYDPFGRNFEAMGNYSAYASPGAWLFYEDEPRQIRDPLEFDLALTKLEESGCQFLLITTWNEWHEGTQVEPGQLINRGASFIPNASSYGFLYIDLIHDHMNTFMPSHISLECLSPTNNSVVERLDVPIHIKIQDPYSNSVKAYLSIDGGDFQQMVYTKLDHEGHLHFNLTLKDYLHFNSTKEKHEMVIYTKDEFDYISDNFEVIFETPPFHAFAVFKCSPDSLLVGESILFNASLSHSQHTEIVSYEWNFGDGNITEVEEPIIRHAYTDPGTYTVVLKITDAKGFWNATSVQLTITSKTDLNADGTVNIVDISIVAMVFGTQEGDENYNPLADLDGNKQINIVDVSIVALDYGKTV